MGVRFPAGDGVAVVDQPQPAQIMGGGGIHGRRARAAARMAVIAADHREPLGTGRPVGVEQRLPVDREAPLRIGCGIGRHNRTGHDSRTADQQPARLLGRRSRGMPADKSRHPACNPPFHPEMASPMGDAPSTVEVALAPGMAGWRLDRALAATVTTLSRERLKALISAGAVTLDGVQRRDPALKVRGGEACAVAVPAPRPTHTQAQDIPLVILFEDAHLLIVDKPAGLVVHPAAGNLDGTLVNALLHHCAGRLSGIGGVARPGIVHRIDKDTSGLLVVAKTDPAHEGLSRQFARHSVERRYSAVVNGVPAPPAGRIEGALARSAANRQKMAIVADGRGKHAVTHYRTLAALTGAAHVECRLETGRTHQVRVHMASIGHPLLGDPAYGGKATRHRNLLDELGFHRQALHARTLGFLHPVSQEKLCFESPLPPDIQQLISLLGPA